MPTGEACTEAGGLKGAWGSNQLNYRPDWWGLPTLGETVALVFKTKTDVRALIKRISLSFKEVIQPQVPLGLPCYDFTLVMNHTVVSALLERLDYLLLVQPTPMV